MCLRRLNRMTNYGKSICFGSITFSKMYKEFYGPCDINNEKNLT